MSVGTIADAGYEHARVARCGLCRSFERVNHVRGLRTLARTENRNRRFHAVDYFKVEWIEDARVRTHGGPPFGFRRERKHSGSLSHRGPVLTVSGDSITLNRVRLESEYLVSQCGTFPRNAAPFLAIAA
jgi:hypothetical protein